MESRIWKIIAVPLIVGGAISIVYSIIVMDPFRVLISEMIVLLLGLLIMLFRKEHRYLAFYITGLFIGLKLLVELILIFPVLELYVWIDLIALLFMGVIGTALFRGKETHT